MTIQTSAHRFTDRTKALSLIPAGAKGLLWVSPHGQCAVRWERGDGALSAVGEQLPT